MTRAVEFCYVAERSDGQVLLAMSVGSDHGIQSWRWTDDPQMAMRMTAKWCESLALAWPLKLRRTPLGFRKVLAG